MADPRFFRNAGPFSIGDISTHLGLDLPTGIDADRMFTDVMPLDSAGSEHVSFLDNRKYIPAFEHSKAGACIVSPDLADRAPDGMITLVTPTPYHVYARAAWLFYPTETPSEGIHASASVAKTAIIGVGSQIDAGAVICDGATIGDGCHIGPNCVIDVGVQIGSGTKINANATIANALVGENVIIHSGVRIGQDGFGFAMGPGGHEKVPQLGRVIIGDDVEIGANTTIDRGTGPDTEIGTGSKIDNLVQIGHNVKLGRHCVIVSQVGISGSTELGDFAVLAGQAGVAGHLKIGTGAQVAAQSGLMRDVEPGQKVGGSPAKPVKQWLRETAALERLTKKKRN